MNPFLHDRQKTFQPRDLWESLLKFAIILFTVDVGVRRIQIGRDEWLRAMRVAAPLALLLARARRARRRREESLAALLARRQQVRSQQTAPAAEPRPDLFRPNESADHALAGRGSPPPPRLRKQPPPPAEAPKAAR